jgi:uncharacterized membrane protein
MSRARTHRCRGPVIDENGVPNASDQVHAQAQASPRMRTIHWHVALTHFPISLFGIALLFQILHLFMFTREFELAATVCILGGAASVIPAVLSGWLTWKKRYHGANTWLFRRKIRIAVAMLVISSPLAAWRVALYYLGREADGIDHYVFFVLCVLLVVGSIVEGFYGGRLSHK